ncbi:hypothetical protein PXU57_005227 [Salmonella enterica subsp. enterica]|nr:hypothetical protein [Salmonella enterica subsp. enterica]
MSEGHGSASDTTAQYCAGFFFYDSEASQATVWRMVTRVSNGSSPPLPVRPGFNFHSPNRTA